MAYDFSKYIREEKEQEYLRFQKLIKEEPIIEMGKSMQKDYEELLEMQHGIGNNRKNVERHYAALIEQKMQKHENIVNKRSVCKML